MEVQGSLRIHEGATRRRTRGRAGMFANQGESLHLPALQVNFAPVGYLCDRERER